MPDRRSQVNHLFAFKGHELVDGADFKFMSPFLDDWSSEERGCAWDERWSVHRALEGRAGLVGFEGKGGAEAANRAKRAIGDRCVRFAEGAPGVAGWSGIDIGDFSQVNGTDQQYVRALWQAYQL